MPYEYFISFTKTSDEYISVGNVSAKVQNKITKMYHIHDLERMIKDKSPDTVSITITNFILLTPEEPFKCDFQRCTF